MKKLILSVALFLLTTQADARFGAGGSANQPIIPTTDFTISDYENAAPGDPYAHVLYGSTITAGSGTAWTLNGAAQFAQCHQLSTNNGALFYGLVNSAGTLADRTPGNTLTLTDSTCTTIGSHVTGTALAIGQSIYDGVVQGTTITGVNTAPNKWNVSISQATNGLIPMVSSDGQSMTGLIDDGTGTNTPGTILTVNFDPGLGGWPTLPNGLTLTGGAVNSLSQNLENQGAFRFDCNSSHLNYDDVILFPGIPGGSNHLHLYFGNKNTNYTFTNYSMVRASGNGSTCPGGPINRTAYWEPALIDNLTGNVVIPDFHTIYYKSNRYSNSGSCPNGVIDKGNCTISITPTNFSTGQPQLGVWQNTAFEKYVQLPRGFRYIAGTNNHYTVVAAFNGSISGTVLTVNSISSGSIQVGQTIIAETTPIEPATIASSCGANCWNLTGISQGTVASQNYTAGSGGNFYTGGDFHWGCEIVPSGVSANGYPSIPQLWAAVSAAGHASDGQCPRIEARLEAAPCLSTWQQQAPDGFGGFGNYGSDGFGHPICPQNHAFTTVFFTVISYYERGTANFSGWRLSSDGGTAAGGVPGRMFAGGQSFHNDWFGGWDYQVMDIWMTHSEALGSSQVNGYTPQTADLQNNSDAILGDGTQLCYTCAAVPGQPGGGGVNISLNETVYPNNEVPIPPRP